VGVRLTKFRTNVKNDPVVRKAVRKAAGTDSGQDVDDIESALAALTSTLSENTTITSPNTVALFGPVSVNDNITLEVEDDATVKIKDILSV
jgi:hypothetical protein